MRASNLQVPPSVSVFLLPRYQQHPDRDWLHRIVLHSMVDIIFARCRRCSSRYPGLQWATTSFLNHFDYTDDVCFFSNLFINVAQMALNLEKEANRVGLKKNTKKINVLTGPCNLPVYVNFFLEVG